MRRALCVLASILSLAACVSEPKRLSAAMDPSNPEAPEAPPAAPPSAFAAPTSEPSRAPEGAGHAQHGAASEAPAPDAGATVYTCPMHPEVRSSKPGNCPKCGMKLVPVKPEGSGRADAGQPGSAPSGHDHGHGHGAHP